jgi:O-antigen/teichoic acid export membrane protein
MIVSNLLGLIAAVVFARALPDYGALAALVSYLVILTVGGQALQVATARESAVGRLGEGVGLRATLRSWGRSLAIGTLIITVISILARHQIAAAVGVPNESWAAAAGLPAGCVYVGVCSLRGILQGLGHYREVGVSLAGEQAVRLLAGGLLVALGAGVAGAYLGSLICYLAMLAYLVLALRRAVPATAGPRSARTLWQILASSGLPVAALAVIQFLQNIDLIIAKHLFDERVASAYAATAVAAKVLIWLAMGVGYYLVPETSRRHAQGHDPRPVLLQSLGMIAVCAIPVLLIFGFGGHELLSIVFGAKRAAVSDTLVPLAIAFTVLAITYLAVQYMLALGRARFLVILALVAIAEPVALLEGPSRPETFATIVLVVQAAGAAFACLMALRRPPATAPTPAETQRPAQTLEKA